MAKVGALMYTAPQGSRRRMLRAIDHTVVDADCSAADNSAHVQRHCMLGAWNVNLGVDDVGLQQAVRAGF